MNKERLINTLLEGFETPKGKAKSEIWQNIEKSIGALDETPVVKLKTNRTKRFIPFVAAASIALVAFFLFPSSSDEFAFNNDSNQLVVETLPDGSSITVSPQSEVTYSSSSDGREVKLKGEAFFEVVKGNRFTVITDNGEVEVVGTSFSVNSRVDQLDVKCFTGKVKVENSGKTVMLTKGLGTTSVSSGKVYQHSLQNKLGQNGSLNFDNLSLDLVVEDLKIYKNLSIKNLSGNNPSVSVDFLDEDNQTIVEVLAKISGLKIKKVGDFEYELY